MPRRSQAGFTGILPPELVERCLEFLPFEEVHTNVKQISKEKWPRDELHMMMDVARALSRNWQDRRKAAAFVSGVDDFVQQLDLGDSD